MSRGIEFMIAGYKSGYFWLPGPISGESVALYRLVVRQGDEASAVPVCDSGPLIKIHVFSDHYCEVIRQATCLRMRCGAPIRVRNAACNAPAKSEITL